MNPNKVTASRLELLPQDILGLIITKVGAESPVDYRNALLSCKEVGATKEDERVCAALNLGPLVRRPLEAFKYPDTMRRCIKHNNIEAHYIRGILEYFVINRTNHSLYHLKKAADAGKEEAIYLYAVILLCSDRYEESESYFAILKYEQDRALADKFWINIKESLNEIKVLKKRIYFISLRKIKPSGICHLNDMQNSCPKCFILKVMVKFIFQRP